MARHFLRKCSYCLKQCLRKQSTQQAVFPELDADVLYEIENNSMKPKKHPGIRKISTTALPDDIVKAISLIAEDHPIKTVLGDGKMLANYLFSRHHPWEEEELERRRNQFTTDVKQRVGSLAEDASEEQVQHYREIVRASVTRLMNKYNYKWSPLDLQDYSSMVYLMTRAAPNYAAAVRTFSEITCVLPNYAPTSLFDFGSGVGSVYWAARSCWGERLKQAMCVDSSGSMNRLAARVLAGGRDDQAQDDQAPATPADPVHFREFLPAQHSSHSLVVCAHSLMELPSRENRLELLLNLYHKTKDFLVVIEQGTKPGFKLVVEARDFILSLATEKKPAHVFAPCPHDGACPRALRGPYPCHVQTTYFDIPVGKKTNVKKELLSYVIIRKGRRGGEGEGEGRADERWPRVVRPVLPRHNHVVCRLCTAQGELQEIIVTRNRHGRELYKCTKKTNWGDKLPVRLTPVAPPQDDCDTSPSEPIA